MLKEVVDLLVGVLACEQIAIYLEDAVRAPGKYERLAATVDFEDP